MKVESVYVVLTRQKNQNKSHEIAEKYCFYRNLLFLTRHGRSDSSCTSKVGNHRPTLLFHFGTTFLYIYCVCVCMCVYLIQTNISEYRGQAGSSGSFYCTCDEVYRFGLQFLLFEKVITILRYAKRNKFWSRHQK